MSEYCDEPNCISTNCGDIYETAERTNDAENRLRGLHNTVVVIGGQHASVPEDIQKDVRVILGALTGARAELAQAKADLAAERERAERVEEDLRTHLEWHRQVCPVTISNAEKNDDISREMLAQARSEQDKTAFTLADYVLKVKALSERIVELEVTLRLQMATHDQGHSPCACVESKRILSTKGETREGWSYDEALCSQECYRPMGHAGKCDFTGASIPCTTKDETGESK